ncbi:MAG: redox-sensing transcriptional repressor Rex [Clostridia bacterium]|nr:redox-sensing transcriptional repressor Rex [Clostridia bacterium]MBQ2274358.1 redox-sensing transcriptional repressor Rex [Clostridia bacterium]MBQ5799051.1 redox-sensing transcriptional repressor Rex [Clostridia bacterium]MBQ5900435.1 redox-sensing transcriptional repressor Rex [Clostridia bacterium]MEE1278395.1 redox-sensing transcriptional repressor Rex [Acutalibacteraceae bacterium]
MDTSRHISDLVIKRLPRYYRFLGELRNSGMSRISSRELADKMGLTASQIRQDLNCFGGFGQQGYGYNVEQLHEEIGHILGLDRKQKAILIGVGNLGRAIANHIRFEQLGFQLIGIFDKKESLTGDIVRNLPVRNTAVMDEFCRENLPDVAILCIPKEDAMPIAEQLIKLGVRGFWNFSHEDISVKHPDVSVENVHFGDSLMTLRYRIK